MITPVVPNPMSASPRTVSSVEVLSYQGPLSVLYCFELRYTNRSLSATQLLSDFSCSDGPFLDAFHDNPPPHLWRQIIRTWGSFPGSLYRCLNNISRGDTHSPSGGKYPGPNDDSADNADSTRTISVAFPRQPVPVTLALDRCGRFVATMAAFSPVGGFSDTEEKVAVNASPPRDTFSEADLATMVEPSLGEHVLEPGRDVSDDAGSARVIFGGSDGSLAPNNTSCRCCGHMWTSLCGDTFTISARLNRLVSTPSGVPSPQDHLPSNFPLTRIFGTCEIEETTFGGTTPRS